MAHELAGDTAEDFPVPPPLNPLLDRINHFSIFLPKTPWTSPIFLIYSDYLCICPLKMVMFYGRRLGRIFITAKSTSSYVFHKVLN